MWQPIETAPRDRKIWVHNGVDYGVAEWFVGALEPEFLQQWNSKYHVFAIVPNPNAGKFYEFWIIKWASNNTDYDDQYLGPKDPLGWMDLPEIPK